MSRKQKTADLLASIEKLEYDLEKVRAPESQSIKSAELFKKRKCPLSKAEIRLAVAVIGACASVLFFIVLWSRILKKPATNYALCLTADCVQHVALLTSHLNQTIDPCDDHAAFVCSAWEPTRAHAELARSATDDLRFTYYDHFVDTLKRGSLIISAGRKPLAMYDMYRTNYPHDVSQTKLVRKALRVLGLG